MNLTLTTPDLRCEPVPPHAEERTIADSLTAAEAEACAALRFPARRSQWLAGRLAAKELVHARHRLAGPRALRAIEIQNLTAGPERGRPYYRLDGQPGPFSLSISHSGRLALAALASNAEELVGADVERVERREAGFEALALAKSELSELSGWCGVARWRAVTRIWALKEALLKALGLGLRVPLTHIVVLGPPGSSLAARLSGRRARLEPGVPGEEPDWSFAVTPESRSLDPRLAALERVRSAASTFDLGDLVGAWVVLSSEEEACNLR